MDFAERVRLVLSAVHARRLRFSPVRTGPLPVPRAYTHMLVR